MNIVYIVEQGAKVSFSAGFFIVATSENKEEVPAENLDGLSVFGNVQITTQAVNYCLQNHVIVQYYSASGMYQGMLVPPSFANPFRQRKQIMLTENAGFSTALAKEMIISKLNNQMVLLRRYARNDSHDIEDALLCFKQSRHSLEYAKSIEAIMGYEGISARKYFETLSQMVNEDFKFDGRSKRPSLDPFNTMLNFGYAVLRNLMQGAIEAHKLNPYFGFLHADKMNHHTLASDLMEEWRAVIVDSTVMSLVNGNEIFPEHFYTEGEEGGTYLTKEGIKIFIRKLENKLATRNKYLSYIDYPVNFREAIGLQVGNLAKAIDTEDVLIYNGVKLR
jgi:CRISPR-associated protein Cas1